MFCVGIKTTTTYHSTHWNACHAAPPQSVELAFISAGKILLVMTQTNLYVCTLWHVPHIVSHSQPEISTDLLPQPCCLAACVPCCPHGLQKNSRAGITALWCQSWSYWACPGDSHQPPGPLLFIVNKSRSACRIWHRYPKIDVVYLRDNIFYP